MTQFQMQSLAVLAIPVIIVHGLAILGPPLADLVRREDARIGWWWWAPVVLAVLDTTVITTGALVVTLRPGAEQAAGARIGVGVGLLILAGIFVAMSIALSCVRGITPGGPTERRTRSSLVAGLTCIGIMLAIAFASAYDDDNMVMAWLVPAAWGGLAWVIGVNRTGTERIDTGRKASAAWLVLAGIAAALSVLEILLAFESIESAEWTKEHWRGPFADRSVIQLLTISGICWTSLMVGFRAVSGPLPKWLLPVALLLALPMGIGRVLWWTFEPIPGHLELPEAIGVDGTPVQTATSDLTRPICVQTPKNDRFGCRNDYESALIALEPDQPLTEVELPIPGALHDAALLSDGTVISVHFVHSRDEFATVVERTESGGYRLSGPSAPDGAEYPQGTLPKRNAGHVIVVQHPDWTVQDWLSICASLGGATRCSLTPR